VGCPSPGDPKVAYYPVSSLKEDILRGQVRRFRSAALSFFVLVH
jgi:hypothetical protein